jgi:SAM-dependent methyltransferase
VDTYTHGHADPVLQSHRWRTVENSAAYLIPSLRPGLDLLDVGCGPGTITVDLAARVAPGRVLGIDVSADPLGEARSAAERAGVPVTFEVGDVYALAAPDDSFDVVHAHQVLQHLTDPVAALREMARVCRPGGVVAVRDVDYAATTYTDLNFIVEHAGIPRIDDFAYMAVQEPNVYAGCSVVIGALMHARPKFFARVMGELLFWVGEDRMTFGSDYNIWTPKWQIEGFVDWQMPDDEAFSDYPRLTTATKKKILGLNAAKLYGIDVPPECQVPTSAGEQEQPGEQLLTEAAAAGSPA